MKKTLLVFMTFTAVMFGAKAQIVYTDLETNPVVLDASNTDYELNFMGGNVEFMIQNYYAMDASEVSFFACMEHGSGVIATPADYNANINLLSQGMSIDGSKTFYSNPDDNDPAFPIIIYSGYMAWNNQRGYVGCKFANGGNTYYGWVDMEVNATAITIYGYAYQSTPNASINAGDNGLGNIYEVENNKISVYPNPAKNYLTLTGIKNTDNIQVVNILGQETNDVSIEDKVMDISSLKEGVYFIKMFSKEGLVTKKFIKKR